MKSRPLFNKFDLLNSLSLSLIIFNLFLVIMSIIYKKDPRDFPLHDYFTVNLILLFIIILRKLFYYIINHQLFDSELTSKYIYSRMKSYIRSHLDSIVLTFIYVSVLTLITYGIIYLTNNLIGLSMHQGLFVLLLYYILEVSTLFLSLPFREYPTYKNPRSWPTLGILLSTPFALIYLSIHYRHIDFCKLEGIYITWMLTRYNVVNPIWLRPQEQTENYDSGLKGMLFKLNKKPASHPIPSLS